MRYYKLNVFPKIALLRSATKPFEKRIPIHPSHFNLINPEIKEHLFIEEGYLQDFDCSDSFCQEQGIRVENRDSLLSSADCCLLVRPMPTDLLQMKNNSVALGWMHCIQNQDMTNAAIRRSLTLVCMEGLFTDEGQYFFEENSRITGQQAIRYALNITDRLDPSQKVAVIGHGNAGIAAIHELFRIGFKEITCFSKRSKSEISNHIEGVEYVQIYHEPTSTKVFTMNGKPILNSLRQFQIIVNATTQNIYKPSIFIHTSEIEKLKNGTLIIDISCDRNMGFEFSEITFLNLPVIRYDFMSYCAIDHLPTLDFDNASKAISQSLIKIIPSLFEYLTHQTLCTTLEKAIEIQGGKILNSDILYYREHFLNPLRTQNFKQIKQSTTDY